MHSSHWLSDSVSNSLLLPVLVAQCHSYSAEVSVPQATQSLQRNSKHKLLRR
jgi:hypothetical protein